MLFVKKGMVLDHAHACKTILVIPILVVDQNVFRIRIATDPRLVRTLNVLILALEVVV